MVRFEISQPRRVRPPDGADAAAWVPWLETALLVRVEIPAWGHAEETWLHWAFRVAPDGRPGGAALAYDPGCRAAIPGAPEAGVERFPTRIRESEVCGFVAEQLASWRPVVHRHRELGVVSRLDEPAESFRRRCLAPLRPLLQRGGASTARAEVAARIGALASGIESMRLGAASLSVRCAQAAEVWYPEGTGPALSPADRMVAGTAQEAR
jgi:hypothetical protein